MLKEYTVKQTRSANLLAILLALILTGCATQQTKQLTREEWLQTKSRSYKDRSPEQVFSAAETVFLLADAKDMSFAHTNNSMKAVRWTAPFPVHIWFHWDIGVEPLGGGSSVNVQISTTAHGFGVPGGMTPYEYSPDVISLFYSRLDYLLGKSATWDTCDGYKSKNPNAATLEALCLLADDLHPQETK